MRVHLVRKVKIAAVVSTGLVGVAGGVIFTMFTFLPARWFPEGERGLATSLAVQATYAGWALGALIPIVLGSGGTGAILRNSLRARAPL